MTEAMWELVTTVVIVGVALFFAGRSLVRSFRGRGDAGCGGKCTGCTSGGRRKCGDTE